jgi:hypothetical protein
MPQDSDRNRHWSSWGPMCPLRAVPVNYTSGLSATSMDLYYHTTAEEKQHMFPIDPHIANPRVETSTGMSTCRDAFHNDMDIHDLSCVVTGSPAKMCDAVQILPHRKEDHIVLTDTIEVLLMATTIL